MSRKRNRVIREIKILRRVIESLNIPQDPKHTRALKDAESGNSVRRKPKGQR